MNYLHCPRSLSSPSNKIKINIRLIQWNDKLLAYNIGLLTVALGLLNISPIDSMHVLIALI